MLRALLACAAVLWALSGTAQSYPARPVRIVVPASPGGASDLVARLVAAQLTETLGQPFIVENRVTSGGIVGTQQVAESPPDGHTLLVTFDTFASNALLFKNLKWDPIRDFAPVMQLCRYPQVLLVHPSLKVHSVKDFVALEATRLAAQLRVRGPGLLQPSRVRAVQGRRRHRHGPGALQGRRARAAGPALRPGAGHADPGRRPDPAVR